MSDQLLAEASAYTTQETKKSVPSAGSKSTIPAQTIMPLGSDSAIYLLKYSSPPCIDVAN
jgi:hypothetical protein